MYLCFWQIEHNFPLSGHEKENPIHRYSDLDNCGNLNNILLLILLPHKTIGYYSENNSMYSNEFSAVNFEDREARGKEKKGRI